ncbi:MAG: DUF5011 domain-containing protein [Bacteroidales bacterium]|jgi:hypothetical protein|nr:DUF5011 domain-containing protein [Bacteroidales bacterium]HPF00658.1 DUF5011 domain-containing protein [Bacteroidales bacterium]
MKKTFLKFAVAIAAVAFIGVSCTEDDITNPTITITGSAAVTIDLGDTYTDAGATANDDKDGDLTSQITTTGTVDVNKVGIYEIEYTVSDEAGNTTTETRTVTVQANRLAGSYNVSCVITGAGAGNYNFVEVVTGSSVNYNYIYFADFCGFPGLQVQGTVSGAGITFNQTKNYDWDDDGTATDATITGSTLSAFTVTAGATPIAALSSLTYVIDYGASQMDNCTSTYTKQ